MLYTDGIHLISNVSKEELVDFGKSIGLNPSWLQEKNKYFHFDLMGKKIQAAIDKGAVKVTKQEIIEILKDAKANVEIKKESWTKLQIEKVYNMSRKLKK